MKYLFALLLLAFCSSLAFAQTTVPVREATNVYKDPVAGPRKFELERFSTQLSRLREACTARNAAETASFESAILTAMRQAVEERHAKPLPLATADRDLQKMQQLFADF